MRNSTIDPKDQDAKDLQTAAFGAAIEGRAPEPAIALWRLESGELFACNPSFQQWLGYLEPPAVELTRDEVIGEISPTSQPVSTFENRPKNIQLSERIFRTARDTPFEVNLRSLIVHIEENHYEVTIADPKQGDGILQGTAFSAELMRRQITSASERDMITKILTATCERLYAPEYMLIRLSDGHEIAVGSPPRHDGNGGGDKAKLLEWQAREPGTTHISGNFSVAQDGHSQLTNQVTELCIPIDDDESAQGQFYLLAAEHRPFSLLDLYAIQSLAEIANDRFAALYALRSAGNSTDRQPRVSEKLDALIEIIFSSSSALELDETLSTLSDQLVNALGISGCSISRWFPEQGLIKRQFDRALGKAAWFDLSGTASSVRDYRQTQQVLETGSYALIHADDPAADPNEIKRMNEQGAVSVLLLPMRRGKEVLGLLELHDNQRRMHLSELDIYYCQAVSDHAGAIVNKTRMFKENRLRAIEIEAQLHETRSLAQLSQALNESLDTEEILGLVETAIANMIPVATQITVHILDTNKHLLVPVQSSTAQEATLEMRLGAGIAGMAAAQRKLLNVGNVEAHSSYIKSERSQTGSLLSLPIQGRDVLLGTISVSCQKLNYFSERHENLMQQFANLAAIAVQNAQLIRKEQDERELGKILLQASLLLNSSINLNAILDYILAQAGKLVPNRSANIMLVSGDSAFIVRHIEDGQSLDPSESVRVSLEWETIMEMKTTRRPIFIPDTMAYQNWQIIDGREWVKSYIGAPMFSTDELVGFINVVDDSANSFANEAPRRLEVLAAHAAVAIKNARLLYELEEALDNEKSTRAQLVQADKLAALGRMVASIAHEINNPIQTVKNTFFLLGHEIEPEGSAARLVDIALSETNRIADLIGQLKDVYRPKPKEAQEPVDLELILDTVQGLMLPHLERCRVSWRQHETEESILVMGYPDRLKQVFINLSVNAIDAMHAANGTGLLEIQVFSDPDRTSWGIEFKDNGPGIPELAVKNIFEPFYTTKESGMGLGLAITYDIVQQHGGRIEITSASDKGTTFVVWLPMIALPLDEGGDKHGF
jgi:signal transduction histidine kinase